MPVTFPDTIPVGQSLLVTVDFNDSLFNVPTQISQLAINSNSCVGMSVDLSASVSHPTPNVYSYVAPAILSCDNQTEDGGITNGGAWTDSTGNSFNASITVISEKWSIGQNFSTSLPVGYVLNGSTNFGPATATNGTPNLVADPGLVPITFTRRRKPAAF